jgi:nucleoside-diphosphate-sugar epimerase
LVTGSAGFVGSHLVDLLLADGHEVVGIDNLFRGSIANHSDALRSPRFCFNECDVLDAPQVERLAAGVECVFHLAAINGTKYFYECPELVMHTNVQGTENVLRAAAVNHVKSVVFTSSSEVYGQPAVVPTPEDAPSVFEPSTSVRWSYAVSKLLDEHMCAAHSRQSGANVAILRLFNAYGPRQVSSSYGQVVGMFAERLLRGKPPVVFGDGQQTRSFTYVEDMVRGIELASRRVSGCTVINIGNSDEVTITDLALLMRSLVSEMGGVVPEPGQLYEHEPLRRCPDISRAKKLLGYSPKVRLGEGLAMTLDWFRSRI